MPEDPTIHKSKRFSNGFLGHDGPVWQLRCSGGAIKGCGDKHRGTGAVVALFCLARVCMRRYLRPRARTSHRGNITQMMCMSVCYQRGKSDCEKMQWPCKRSDISTVTTATAHHRVSLTFLLLLSARLPSWYQTHRERGKMNSIVYFPAVS